MNSSTPKLSRMKSFYDNQSDNRTEKIKTKELHTRTVKLVIVSELRQHDWFVKIVWGVTSQVGSVKWSFQVGLLERKSHYFGFCKMA